MEIERKFLVKENIVEALYQTSPSRIEQMYLSYEPEIRIRKVEKTKKDSEETKYYLTVKSEGTDAREEFETEISQNTYHELLYKAISKKIMKLRYQYDIGNGLTAEVDVYDNFDFSTVEVEFNTIEQAMNFLPPVWFGEEVTQNKHYKNKALAKNRLSLI